MLIEQQQLPFATQSQYIHLIRRRQPATQKTVGKNVFRQELLQEYVLRRQTRQFLGKYYLRFEKLNDGDVKIGVEDDIKAPQEFVARFVECLVQSHMSGYVFIGIKVPLFKELVKVDYTKLRRLELVRCNINNIQPIGWLGCDRFQTIYLGGNFITNICSLAKTSFPHFTSIQLNNNFITDFTPLDRTRMAPYCDQQKNRFYLHTSLESFHTGDLGFAFKVQNTDICIVGESSFLLKIESKYKKVIHQKEVLNRIIRMQQHPQKPARTVRMQRQQ